MEKITKIEINKIDGFRQHPFRVEIDNDMNELVESIKLIGLLYPIIVRHKENNKYELLSGHRIKKAFEILGIKEIDVVIKEINDEEAIIYVVDSNMYREKILPSEKAFAYKMKLDAMKHQDKKKQLLHMMCRSVHPSPC